MPFMSLRPHVILFLLVWATNVGFTVAATSVKQFKHWYPQYGGIFENIMKMNCTAEYDKYITGYKNHSEIDWRAGGGIYTALTQPVIDCLLENTSEFLKGSMTGAQILLGVMPTIIALLGPSHDEIAMLSNVGRRPLLAAGMALASPSAYFSRAFEYKSPAEILSKEEGRLKQWRPDESRLLVSFLEYALVVAACCNVVMNTLEVSRQTISSFSSDMDFMPNLWLVLGLCIHVFSGIVFRLRLRGWRVKVDNSKTIDPRSDEERTTDPSSEKDKTTVTSSEIDKTTVTSSDKDKTTGPSSDEERTADLSSDEDEQKVSRLDKVKAAAIRLKDSFRDVVDSLITWIKGTGPRLVAILTTTEFIPCATKDYSVRIQRFDETKIFLFLAWALSTFTILHVVFGTLVFASILFVGIKDALSIVGRYIAAVVICRVILMYELAGMRECWGCLDGKDPDGKKRNDGDPACKCATPSSPVPSTCGKDPLSSSSSSAHTSPRHEQDTQGRE